MASLYDRDAAAALARGAAVAYGDAAEMEAWAAAQRCGGCAVLRDDATDTLAFVAAAEQRSFVVFRGTRDLRNWLTDLDCRRVKINAETLKSENPCRVLRGEKSFQHFSVSAFQRFPLEVHEGFARALDSIWEPLAEALRQLAPGNRDLFFAGHSLGGALAMLACARWTAQGRAGSPLTAAGSPGAQRTERPTSWLYSFGQPRVGNAAWVRWYDALLRRRSFRIVHADDVVARVPWLLGRFRHAGTEIFFDALGVKHIDWPWWAKAPSDAAGLYAEWRRGQIALLGDHHVATYVEILNADGGMKTIPIGSVISANGLMGSARGADRTPPRGVPTMPD